MKVRHKKVGREYTVAIVGFARTFRGGQLREVCAIVKDSYGKVWYEKSTAPIASVWEIVP